MKLFIICLFAIASTCLGETREEYFNGVAGAIGQIESSNRAQIWGDNGKAWGLFQFHHARYTELGGRNWGSADTAEQKRVMLKEIELVWKKNRNKIDFIRAIGTYHNIGHIVNKETPYILKLRRKLLE